MKTLPLKPEDCYKEPESVEERAYVQLPSEKRYTAEDMEKAWEQSRKIKDGGTVINFIYYKYFSFNDYLESIK